MLKHWYGPLKKKLNALLLFDVAENPTLNILYTSK